MGHWIVWFSYSGDFLVFCFLVLESKGTMGWVLQPQLPESKYLPTIRGSGSSNGPEARNSLDSQLGIGQGHFLLIKGHGLISVPGGWHSS